MGKTGMWKAANKYSGFHCFKCNFHCTLCSLQSNLPLLFPQSVKMFMQRPTPGLYIRHDGPLKFWPARVLAMANVQTWVYKQTGDILKSTVSVSVKKRRSEMLMPLRNVPGIFYTSFSFEDLLSHLGKNISQQGRSQVYSEDTWEQRPYCIAKSLRKCAHNTRHTELTCPYLSGKKMFVEPVSPGGFLYHTLNILHLAMIDKCIIYRGKPATFCCCEKNRQTKKR